MQEIEQYSRRNNIRIKDIEDSERENYMKTTVKVITLCKGPFSGPDLIKNSHRRKSTVRSLSVTKRENDYNEVGFEDKEKPNNAGSKTTGQEAEIYLCERPSNKINACVRKKHSDIVKSAFTREGAISYRGVNEHTHK
ncbi:hypothetical protein DPMN_166410 [Dreissena polymorpha]|uniref:Uncharacterized protein n=1 Tax=Dreissena polymorpha TaxID=45954 RepID=A0A9D4EX10_DREPO|nr:hypothetical protein DPMN_166410 [Dreissena polymorpha]